MSDTLKRPWALALARRYARFKGVRAFDGVHVDGLERARALLMEGPVLFAANHVCFWDAFVMVLVDEALHADGYVVMDRQNLARLSFFRALGALPLDRDSFVHARRDLERAVDVLNAKRRCLWIFPQGEQRPSHLRPLGFKPGVRLLAKRAQVPVVPVALSYVWHESPQPRVHVRFGPAVPAHDVDARDLHRVLEERVTVELDAIDRAFLDKTPPESLLLAGRSSSPESGFGARMLALVRRGA
jgi:1-acyl-sn-glycerol-3-phosphate acyltransferase